MDALSRTVEKLDVAAALADASGRTCALCARPLPPGARAWRASVLVATAAGVVPMPEPPERARWTDAYCYGCQGTLAERMRAGGAGIPGFYTKTGVGTLVAEGKEVKSFGGEDYILEQGIFADVAIVKAWKADATGNTVFRKTARNFNVPAATCGKVCVVEVEELVETGTLDPDAIHLPGVYVQRIVVGAPYDKKIEFRTTRSTDVG